MITAIEIDRETGEIVNVERAEVRETEFRRIINALMVKAGDREETA